MKCRRRDGPPNPALTPGPIYREALRLATNPATTPLQARDWIAREAAMIALHGARNAELACRKELREHEDDTGLCGLCGGPRHDQEDWV